MTWFVVAVVVTWAVVEAVKIHFRFKAAVEDFEEWREAMEAHFYDAEGYYPEYVEEPERPTPDRRVSSRLRLVKGGLRGTKD